MAEYETQTPATPMTKVRLLKISFFAISKKKIDFDRTSRWDVWSDSTSNSILKDSGGWSSSDSEVGAFLYHVRLSPWSPSELVSCPSSVNWIKWTHSDPRRARTSWAPCLRRLHLTSAVRTLSEVAPGNPQASHGIIM